MNTITIDLDLLSEQQDAIIESDLDEDIKEGLNNMISTILDIAEDRGQVKKVNFAMVDDND